jgi:hypothetical protein
MMEACDGRQVVGIDLHRRRSVLVRMTGDGRRLETIRIDNSGPALGHDRGGRHQPAGSPPRELKDRITARRGSQARNIAKTAAARKLLTRVFYAMRDGEVRSLAAPARALQAG